MFTRLFNITVHNGFKRDFLLLSLGLGDDRNSIEYPVNFQNKTLRADRSYINNKQKQKAFNYIAYLPMVQEAQKSRNKWPNQQNPAGKTLCFWNFSEWGMKEDRTKPCWRCDVIETCPAKLSCYTSSKGVNLCTCSITGITLNIISKVNNRILFSILSNYI